MQKLKHTSILRVLTALTVWGVPVLVHAQATGAVATAMTGIASVIGIIITGLNLLMWVVFIFLNILLDPSFMMLDSGPFVDMLNSIWVLSRDLMNIGFALLLIGAAIYTIVTAKKDLITTHLKTFVLSVILINFSWFIPRVILDVANVAAATVYGIPTLVSTTAPSACTITANKAVPGLTCSAAGGGSSSYTCTCGMVVNASFFPSDADIKAMTAPGAGWQIIMDKILYVQMEDLDPTKVAAHSAILNGLIVNHARLSTLATVPPSSGSSTVVDMIKFVLREGILLFIHIALFFPMVAILLAFAIRIPVLWLTIAFMPFIFLKYVLPNSAITEYPQKLMEHFIKAAFLPAIVGLPLSIGFMLINAGSGIVSTLPSTVVLGITKGIPINLNSYIGSFWELLWLVISLGVIWVGVFAALEKMGAMSWGSQAIKGFGQSLGALALKAPLALPIIPGGMSPLYAMRNLNPRNIGHALSTEPEGLKGVLDRIKNKGALPDPAKFTSSASKYASDTAAMNTLTQKIEELTNQIERSKTAGNAADRADAQQKIKDITADIKTRFEIDIDDTNVHSSLKSYRDALQNSTKLDPGKLTEIDNKLGNLDAKLKLTTTPLPGPGTPPATPTPPAPATPPTPGP